VTDILMKHRIRAVVMGTVQGVGYRYFAINHAAGLGIVGYARNLQNGNVEVVAEGEEQNLDQFIDLLKHGPMGAYIREVVTVKLPATGEFRDFVVRY
jgi:acylphosphatase